MTKDTRSNEILVATRNAGKLRELNDMLGELPVVLRSLAEFPDIRDVEETGSTFAENAELKAREYARSTGLPALADDSGLEVAALGGRPGVLSARYGGETDYLQKMQMLLEELRTANASSRSARFVCSMVLALPDGEIRFAAEAVCDGTIALAPAGTGGFGFDPIFIPVNFDLTFGELPDKVKKQISHRARAAKIFMHFLPDFIGV